MDQFKKGPVWTGPGPTQNRPQDRTGLDFETLHMQCFPDIHFPTEDCVCPGCALGKMPNQAFSENKRCATKPFELVHSDLKSFLVMSYWKFKYIITFYDDFTSHAWTMALHSKVAAITATKYFLKWCASNIMCRSLAGCLMLAENTSLIYLIEHSLKRELRYTKVLHGPPCRMAMPSD